MKKISIYILVISTVAVFLGAFLRLENGSSSKTLFSIGIIAFLLGAILFAMSKFKKAKAE